MTGFLKKLPQFPICFGSGSFEVLIFITAFAILEGLADSLPSNLSISPYFVESL